jgi:two-component system C4-dicarboxylate transport response regulator DctD
MVIVSMQKTLLIVDDESDIRETLAETLKSLGAKIFLAKDGLEALGLIQAHKIMAIISDVNMPVMKGTELLRKIRELGYLTPFVILTAYGDKKMALEALRLGAFDFIDKPWSIEKLVSVTEKILEIGNEIMFWESEVDIQRSVFNYQDENSQRLIAALTREDGFDFKKKL